jgi:transposase
MLRLTFTEAEKRALEHERFHHPHPRVRRKMEVLWLKSQGLAHQEIARLAGVGSKTMRSFFQEYVEGGIGRLREVHFRQPQSELMAHQGTIEAYFHDHPPASINEALAAITELTGLTRSPTQVRLFLKEKCGLKRLKTGVLPAKADNEVQAAFKKRPRTAFGSSASGPARSVLCRCGAFRLGGIPVGLGVGRPGLDQSALGSASLQRVGCAQGRDERGHHRRQFHLHQFQLRVRAAL